ncbi:hypothetical protein LTR27_006378 [Elasticomyces elasticus]|nr:hypothetical protein LTR27_006378 [Elasticomyces elasticus]
MPMIWNTEAHAKLLAALMQECDVKPNEAQKQALAKIMGCTPKAITHQISKFRNASIAEEGKIVRPKARKAPAKGKKAARTPSPEADGDDEEAQGPTPPPSTRPKRESSKRDYAAMAGEGEDDDELDGLNKKVKIEVGEDIGEGLRSSTHFEDAMADGDDGDAFT